MNIVLLIEDDAWLADLYADILRAAGYQVVRAADAQQGLEQLDAHAIDVIVLDLLLPSQNGVALLQELRSYPDLAEIPIILQSAVEGLALSDWRAYGVVEHLSKVHNRPQELVQAVQRALGADHEAV